MLSSKKKTRCNESKKAGHTHKKYESKENSVFWFDQLNRSKHKLAKNKQVSSFKKKID